MQAFSRIVLSLSLAFLTACATDTGFTLSPEGRKRSDSAWPLSVLSDADVAPVESGAQAITFYFVCQTKFLPLPHEKMPDARWKLNFVNFTRASGELFDCNTTTVQGAAGLIQDELGGWFLVVPPVERISGEAGITKDGIVFVRRDVFTTKFGDGLVRCKYKHPNRDGNPDEDRVYSSDMTLMGITTREVAYARSVPK